MNEFTNLVLHSAEFDRIATCENGYFSDPQTSRVERSTRDGAESEKERARKESDPGIMNPYKDKAVHLALGQAGLLVYSSRGRQRAHLCVGIKHMTASINPRNSAAVGPLLVNKTSKFIIVTRKWSSSFRQVNSEHEVK